ncbi:MAG: hypothetical protein ACE5HZ_06695 [Fidelibacterota bacterium]
MQILVILLLIGSTVSAQDRKLFWDGRDWQRLHSDPGARAAYVNGLLDGRLYDFLRVWPADSTLADSLFAGEITDYLTTSELVRSLDNFYYDPLNQYVPIASAVIIVNMRGQGQSTEMIEAYTKKSKEWINRLTLELQKEDMVRLMKEKRDKLRAIQSGSNQPPDRKRTPEDHF